MLRPESNQTVRNQPDAATFLTFYLLALFVIPSRLVIGPLGGAGTPAQVVALAGLAWWMFYQAQRPHADMWEVRPVRLGLLALFFAFAASFVTAMARPIDSAETSTACLGMVIMLGWLGVSLVAHDGLQTWERFDRLVGRLVVGASALALLGLVQFLTNEPLMRDLPIPGLTANIPLTDVYSRSGFTRPAGTALHPIEFGAVLTMVMPIAIVRARLRSHQEWVRAWFPVVIFGVGIVVSGSRSAVLCFVVGLVTLSMGWSLRARLATAAALPVLFAAVSLVFPGILGSLMKLFTGIENDGSVLSRTDSYALVVEFIGRAPFLGRGFSTFLPSYRILDNEYLLLLVEVGLVGLLAFFGVMGGGVICALRAWRTQSAYVSSHGQAFLAAIVSSALGLAMYDGLSFPMSTGVLFLVLGLSGALWQLSKGPRPLPDRYPSSAVFERR